MDPFTDKTRTLEQSLIRQEKDERILVAFLFRGFLEGDLLFVE